MMAAQMQPARVYCWSICTTSVWAKIIRIQLVQLLKSDHFQVRYSGVVELLNKQELREWLLAYLFILCLGFFNVLLLVSNASTVAFYPILISVREISLYPRSGYFCFCVNMLVGFRFIKLSNLHRKLYIFMHILLWHFH